MRTFFVLPVVGATLLLCSCGGPSVTKADLKNFKLGDLKLWGTPPVVEVDESTLQRPEDFLAYYEANFAGGGRRAAPGPGYAPPVDFRPPSLPASATTYDGSLLPPKSEGGSAVLDVEGNLPGEEPDYSIE